MNLPSKPARRLGSFAMAAAAVLAVFYAAMIPAQRRAALHTHGRLHPVFHLAIFGTLALLAMRTTRSLFIQILLAGGVMVFGCATEWIEAHLYGSPLELNDMLLDAVGAVAGTLLVVFAQRRRPLSL